MNDTPSKPAPGIAAPVSLLAACGAWLGAHFLLLGAWTLPPATSTDYLRFQPALVFLLGLIAAVFVLCKKNAFPLAASICGGAIGLASGVLAIARTFSTGSTLSTQQIVLALASAAAWGALLAYPLAAHARAGRRVSAAVVLIGIAAAIAAGLLATGSESLARIAAPMAIFGLAMLALPLLTRDNAPVLTLIAVASGSLAGPITAGNHFSSMPHWLAWLLAGAPLAGLLAASLLGKHDTPALGTAVRIVIPALIAAAGIAPGLIALARLALGIPDPASYSG